MSSLNLKSILQNYEQILCDRIFRYELNKKWNIDVIFYRENFCHLMGTQHVFGKDKKYLGENGYKLIKKDEMTIASLKAHNEKGFAYIKGKVENFDCIYELLTNGIAVKFYADRVRPPTQIEASFLIYHNKKEKILHLLMRRENEKTNEFTPVSFLVKSAKAKDSKQFIDKQEHKKITKFEIIENSKVIHEKSISIATKVDNTDTEPTKSSDTSTTI